MEKVQNFFLFCSGVEPSILEQCPSDKNKYMGIGATVFFTGVLAFFSSAYALYTVFDSALAAVAFGIVWGLMIFNLDRYIVLSMKSNGKWWRDWMVAMPRLALAILLALVISKPLEMKIFEKEINAELVIMEQEVFKNQEDQLKSRYQAQIDGERTQIAALKQEILVKTAARDTLVKQAVQEADGTGGSRNKNLGPIYRAKKAEADKAQAELDQLVAVNQPLIEAKEQTVKELETTIQTEITAIKRDGYDGMAARMEALSRLGEKSLAILYASLFITLLFIAIETAPIMVKLISYRSPYDYLLHEHEHVYQMANLESVSLRSNEVKNKVKYDTETGSHLVMARITAEKALIDHKLKEKLEELKNKPYGWKMGNFDV
ncbi:MAG: DUF4407 domain-containing protein [Lewinellaceae bacterium]|nr:DUF4407 domain-containing protein [Lewinella sp.]MCB9278099.1 DUF4407 domain-containing protein [Lewinellaceae bacterium]